ncbi:MAG: alpha/beta fold hydrolase [Reichenbachiella sp.]
MKSIIKFYFKALSFISPNLAGLSAFNFFQRPLNKKVRKKELTFFKAVKSFKIKHYLEDIHCYELGPKDGPIVILVHGWESNAASLSGIGLQLAEEGYHVVLFNLPAHGFSKLKKANLKICKEVLLEVINHIHPSGPFSIIAHSFGSAVTTYALSKTTYHINNLILLTSPNKMADVFKEYSDFIGLSHAGYINLCNRATKLLKEPLEELAVASIGQKIRYDHMTIIQDENDKVINKEKAIHIYNGWENSELKLVKDKGHYRMLWDQSVIDLISIALKQKKTQAPNNDRLLVKI